MTLPRFAAAQWLIFAAVAAVLLYLLSPILTPFVAAGILAYICNPLVQRLAARKVPRTLAVALVMGGLLLLSGLLLVIMLPLLEKEISLFVTRVPDWIEAARTKLLPQLQQWFGVSLEWDAQALKNLLLSHWQGAGGVAGKVLPWIGSSGGAIAGALVNLLLIPVAMFYLLRDWDALVAQLDELVPRHWHAKVAEIAAEVDGVLAEFLRGQIAVMLLMSLFYVVALWLAGLEFALPIGILAGVLVFVPYLGMILGLSLATLAAAMQFTSFGGVLWVWAAFGAGQLLEGMVVTPWLVGDRIGLHPLAVIFALLAFGQVFGFFGLLLALPLSAILLVALRHGRAWYLTSNMYNKP
ncbi:AI-2E family transporter [Candidatus Ferrigenium straubiae]|jgi:predicted PurR-regulated permease PerM|uniref:AI-2E family transporter n=1 Tax=Candidatus Ferrigenium straubiae TaxID=2919506 RepID=UPI003F4A924F